MAVIDALAGDLVDVDTLLRWITDELVANHRFTARFGDVNAGLPFTVTDTLRWLDRPQAETFYQDSDILWGIRNSDSIRGQDSSTISIGLQLGNALWSAIGEPGSGNRWNDTAWTQDASVIPNFSPDMRDDGSTNGCCPMGVDRLDSGSFIGARMFTSPTSGSATPSEPLYVYSVVECAMVNFESLVLVNCANTTIGKVVFFAWVTFMDHRVLLVCIIPPDLCLVQGTGVVQLPIISVMKQRGLSTLLAGLVFSKLMDLMDAAG